MIAGGQEFKSGHSLKLDQLIKVGHVNKFVYLKWRFCSDTLKHTMTMRFDWKGNGSSEINVPLPYRDSLSVISTAWRLENRAALALCLVQICKASTVKLFSCVG
jgi:hypothetical protein